MIRFQLFLLMLTRHPIVMYAAILNNKQLPPAGAVRTEEMINYFKYQYPQPTGKDPFSVNTEISDCPGIGQ